MAKNKRYTISQYYDTEPLVNEETSIEVMPLCGYDALEDIIKWCEDNNVCISLVLVTEWDIDNLDAYGIPEIVEFNNLDYLPANDIV